jgi:hypothetical protein
MPTLWKFLDCVNIIVVPKAPSNLIRNVKLAMEIICSQKFTQTQNKNSTRRSFRFNKFVLNRKSKKNIEYVTYLAQNTLQGHTMYNIFLRLPSQNTKKFHSIINGNVVVTIISGNTKSFRDF